MTKVFMYLMASEMVIFRSSSWEHSFSSYIYDNCVSFITSQHKNPRTLESMMLEIENAFADFSNWQLQGDQLILEVRLLGREISYPARHTNREFRHSGSKNMMYIYASPREHILPKTGRHTIIIVLCKLHMSVLFLSWRIFVMQPIAYL
jgi:hypothetical protein